jgi:curved DNA-binding protein CbpA
VSREEHKKYFEILELSPEASISEIKMAYNHLKELYSSDSMAISPIQDEFPKKKRRQILKEIETAYAKLILLLEEEQSESIHQHSAIVSEEQKAGMTSFSGPMLRALREKLGKELYEIALDTKIREEILENIELEKFDALPQETYLKAHLSNYAKCLFLNPKKVSDDYIKRYKAWKTSTEI